LQRSLGIPDPPRGSPRDLAQRPHSDVVPEDRFYVLSPLPLLNLAKPARGVLEWPANHSVTILDNDATAVPSLSAAQFGSLAALTLMVGRAVLRTRRR